MNKVIIACLCCFSGFDELEELGWSGWPNMRWSMSCFCFFVFLVLLCFNLDIWMNSNFGRKMSFIERNQIQCFCCSLTNGYRQFPFPEIEYYCGSLRNYQRTIAELQGLPPLLRTWRGCFWREAAAVRKKSKIKFLILLILTYVLPNWIFIYSNLWWSWLWVRVNLI